MKKITLRTKITLTIVGLLAMAGMLYAVISPPSPLPASVSGPVGIAASGTDLIVSEYCSQNLRTINCDGTVSPSPLATIPGPVGPNNCLEKYIAIAPAQSALAASPWTPRDIFVTQGTDVYKISGSTNTATPFAHISSCDADHTGITFDHVGNFGYNMIVTCQNGGVWKVDAIGTATLIADVSHAVSLPAIEGPAVVPKSFGILGGQIWVADEANGQVHAIKNDSTVTTNVLPFLWDGAEAVQVIPTTPSTFCSGGTFFQAIEDFNTIYQYAPVDFAGLGGNILVPSERGAGILLITPNGSSYDANFFDNPGGLLEGSAFADPDVPSTGPGASPTPTPSPSPSPSPSPTPTPTPSPSPSPTATATATATPMGFFTGFVIGDLDAVVGNHVTFWGAQWWKQNHLSRGGSPASFKGFANSPNPNPPTCGGTWQSDPGNSSHPPDTVPADIIVIVSSLITKSGPVISGNGQMMVIVHTDPGYGPAPGHEGTGTVTAVVCR